ncbi:MAG: S8 family serine peptidase, partial [Acidimicrobiales bacterium]
MLIDVIVDGASSDDAAAAVLASGGSVSRRLDVIGAVSADVPASALATLPATGFDVTPNAPVHPTAAQFDEGEGGVNAQVLALNPGRHGSSTGGKGVGVALVDTGIDATHPDLDDVREGIDLSGDDGSSLVDTYGHGTFIAGLIAGERTGVAPGATLISIKVAGKDGSTDLGTLIQAIGWAVVNQDAAGILVLNLSFGTLSPMAAPGDPLVQAVEAAWASGLVVVSAAGNEGPGTVTSPGTSPSALTIGATDHMGTAHPGDDVVAEWSGSAEGRTPKPELVAPGTSLISLRVKGSTVDHGNPHNLIPDGDEDAYFVGSGTSMAAGLASGAAAVVLEHHTGARPGDVKSALVDTSAATSGSARTINLQAAVDTDADLSDGQGTRPRADRGRADGGAPAGFGWSGARWTGARWTEAQWEGARWTGARWTETEWGGARWTGARWTGARWTGGRWTGARWTDAEWTGARWTG